MTPEREAEILAHIHQGKTRNARKYLELGDESGVHYSTGDFDLSAVRRVYAPLKALLEAVQLEADNGIELAESRDVQTNSQAQQALERIAEMIEKGLNDVK